jgi:general stress protein 26
LYIAPLWTIIFQEAKYVVSPDSWMKYNVGMLSTLQQNLHPDSWMKYNVGMLSTLQQNLHPHLR